MCYRATQRDTNKAPTSGRVRDEKRTLNETDAWQQNNDNEYRMVLQQSLSEPGWSEDPAGQDACRGVKKGVETIAMVDVDRHFQAMTTNIICPAAERFGRTSTP